MYVIGRAYIIINFSYGTLSLIDQNQIYSLKSYIIMYTFVIYNLTPQNKTSKKN